MNLNLSLDSLTHNKYTTQIMAPPIGDLTSNNPMVGDRFVFHRQGANHLQFMNQIRRDVDEGRRLRAGDIVEILGFEERGEIAIVSTPFIEGKAKVGTRYEDLFSSRAPKVEAPPTPSGRERQ